MSSKNALAGRTNEKHRDALLQWIKKNHTQRLAQQRSMAVKAKRTGKQR